MPEPEPTVGRIVHYVSHGTPLREDGTQAYEARCRAAVITEVTEHQAGEPRTASLAVLAPEGVFFSRSVPLDGSGLGGGTWHWPERA